MDVLASQCWITGEEIGPAGLKISSISPLTAYQGIPSVSVGAIPRAAVS